MIPVNAKIINYPDLHKPFNPVPCFCANPPHLPPSSSSFWGGAPGTTTTRRPPRRLPTGHQLARHTKKIVVALLSLACACFLALHQLRCRVKRVNDIYLRLVGALLRPHEIHGLPSAFWFVLGTMLAVAIFPRDVALQRCGMRGTRGGGGCRPVFIVSSNIFAVPPVNNILLYVQPVVYAWLSRFCFSWFRSRRQYRRLLVFGVHDMIYVYRALG